MVDVTLIHLPKPYLNQPDAQAPMGILYIAASLEKAGKSVIVKNHITCTDEEAVQEYQESRLYGITITSLELLHANRFAKLIKKHHPEAKICLGGPGTYSDEFVDWDVIDSICKGEGEYTILEMLNDAWCGNLKKIYEGRSVEDLDSLPFPARHLLEDKQGGNIFAYNHNYKEGGSTVILSTRGCPYNCHFCGSPYFTSSHKLRFRSPTHVAAEMKHVVEEYNIRQFRFSDDMFTANRKNVFELCDLINGMDIAWRVSSRVNPIDQEMLEIMCQAGCKEISFGVESFDDSVLEILNKKATTADNVRALELAAKVGIKTRVLMMIRTPGQTKETVKINIDYLNRVPFNIIACTGFIPIPGSAIWYRPDDFNIEILDRNLDHYNFYMYGPDGRRPLDPIIKIKDRPLDEFMRESEEFRDYIEEVGKINRG
jgi:anaerobic magnesium-protoporphyrin IX monomethyl ester cyclase